MASPRDIVITGVGVVSPIGIGGDAFCMLWDPAQRKVVGLNGSGNSPLGLSLETARSKKAADGYLPPYGAVTVNVPGTVDAWWAAHQRYGKLPWAEVLLPVAELCEEGVPMPQLIAWYLQRNMAGFDRRAAIIEENDNRKKVYAPDGRTPRVGEVFANPDLGRTYRMIAEGGRDAFYEGAIADHMERYFRRIGGWMTKADLAPHRTEFDTLAEANGPRPGPFPVAARASSGNLCAEVPALVPGPAPPASPARAATVAVAAHVVAHSPAQHAYPEPHTTHPPAPCSAIACDSDNPTVATFGWLNTAVGICW
jgi:hypothetical protein